MASLARWDCAEDRRASRVWRCSWEVWEAVVANVASKDRPYLAGAWDMAAGRRVVEAVALGDEKILPSRSSGGIIMPAADPSPAAVASAGHAMQ